MLCMKRWGRREEIALIRPDVKQFQRMKIVKKGEAWVDGKMDQWHRLNMELDL